MRKNIRYNIYIFLMTFIRSIIDIYSVVYLYQKGITIKNIIGIYSLTYFIGAFISEYSLKLGNYFNYKWILSISSIFNILLFYILEKTSNPYIISLSLSCSMFTYHPIRHYFGIKILTHQKQIATTLIYSYIASLLATYIAIKKYNLTLLIILSIVSSILPFIINNNIKENKEPNNNNISHKKILFFFLDQFRILFILLEPLYLYTISSNLSYVGIFNIILLISSIIGMYIINKKTNNSNYTIFTILFGIILIIKININYHKKYLLLTIAFLEGLCIKISEYLSTINLYNKKSNTLKYLIDCERIMCLGRTIILSIAFLLNLKLKIILYFLISGIFVWGFVGLKRKNKQYIVNKSN